MQLLNTRQAAFRSVYFRVNLWLINPSYLIRKHGGVTLLPYNKSNFPHDFRRTV